MSNIGESIKTKLKNLAREQGVNVDFVQKRYVNERLLGRLQYTKWADKFCLKGGMMIPVLNNGDMYRPTTDIDFNGIGTGDIKMLKEMINDIFALTSITEGGTLPYEDGLEFLAETVNVSKEREGIIPGGKIEFDVRLSTSKIRMRVDVGFGNPVIPSMEKSNYPSMLSNDKKNPLPQPSVLMYSPYSMVAEKFHAIVQFGLYNTRIRDYYDLYFLTTHMDLETGVISKAINETFKKQERIIPDEIEGLSYEFATENEKQWKRYISNSDLSLDVPSLTEVISTIKEKLTPAIELSIVEQHSL